MTSICCTRNTAAICSSVDFIWEDGEKYHVDRILARERCASRKAGGTGICYTVMVNGKESHLYYEFDKWFIINPSCDRCCLSLKTMFPTSPTPKPSTITFPNGTVPVSLASS